MNRIGSSQVVRKVLLLFISSAFIAICYGGFACLEDPCHHGICMDDLNSTRQCYCQNGYTGYSCEQNWDDCRSWGPSPCRNGGTCLDGIDSFNCSCPEPFAGRLCDIDLSNCQEVFPCENNGTCAYSPESPHETGLVCLCPAGFTGKHCEEDVSVCNTTLNVCLNGGKCVDGIGHKFYCQCPVGWSGLSCEIDVNECASNPCQNEGVCVDKIGDYGCACHRGFTGKSCETKLETCPENPCLNDALCLVEEGKNICYCVPDFHGELCGERYNECEPPDKCFNGGTCVDGVGTFTCSCPLEYFGTSCECSFANVTDDCAIILQNLNLTIPTAGPAIWTTGPPASAISVTLTPSLEVTPSTLLFSSPYDPGGRHDISTLPAVFESLSSSLFMATPTLVSPTVITTFVEETADMGKTEIYEPCPEETPVSTASESLLISPTLTATPYLTEMLPPLATPSKSIFDSYELASEFSTTVGLSLTPSPTFGSELWEVPETSSLPLSLYSASIGLSSPMLTAAETPGITVVESTPGEPRWEVSLTTGPGIMSSALGQTEGEYSSLLTETVMLSTPVQLLPTATEEIVSGSVEASPSPSLTAFFQPRESSLVTEVPLTESVVTPTEPGVTPAPIPTISVPYPGVTQSLSSEVYESVVLASVTDIVAVPVPSIEPSLIITPSATLPPPLSSPVVSVTIGPVVPPVTAAPPTKPSPPSEEPFVTTEAVTMETLPESTTSAPFNLTDPCFNYCQNNAKCIFTSIEPICICHFRFTGVHCERMEEPVNIPSFSGNSYLKYVLPRASPNIIDISSQMATVFPEGILMYAAIGIFYALLFIQHGHLTLHFSCGAQSMHFVETRTRVDDGYNFTVSFRLENVVQEDGELRCIGQVSLNGSYSMRGEQVVDLHALKALEQPTKTVFLGGLDEVHLHSNNDDAARLVPGFRGCVYKLLVNQERVAMYFDAKDGREIAECTNFACAVNPCSEDSRCVSSTKYPFWQCICPPGLGGARCNVRECLTNPCKNGATCTIATDGRHSNGSSSSTELKNSVCLCPLGFSGNLCQSRITITKPSFHGTADYSSFLAYDLVPKFEDWMQLKFHFITKNMSQIALLMYVGSDAEVAVGRVKRQHLDFDSQDSSEKPADFFSISFLQGFIAITWNLGSGAQRITTPSRIDSRLNVHTLFAGRRGKQAWIKVDGMRNMTGRSPGVMNKLNVYSDLYVGGHEIARFEGLPHDLPLHQGFQGCIFDLGFRVINKLYLPKPIRGRQVSNCGEC